MKIKFIIEHQIAFSPDTLALPGPFIKAAVFGMVYHQAFKRYAPAAPTETPAVSEPDASKAKKQAGSVFSKASPVRVSQYKQKHAFPPNFTMKDINFLRQMKGEPPFEIAS